MSSVSRREFLGRVSLGAAGLALVSRGRAAEASSPKKLGVALVGLGSYATYQLAPALKVTEHCELRGVVTGSPDKGRKWAQTFGFPEQNIFSYATMARLADAKDIDIVYVVTPNALHAEEVIAAAQAGKHVISEKPFATTVGDAERAIAACRSAKVKLSLGYRLHFDPYHQELKRLAREKDFGVFTKMTGANGFTMGQKVWRAEHKLAGGGPLMDMGIYCVQAACMAADGAAPIAVTAREHPKTRPQIFADVEEGLDWTMEFAGGAKAELMTSYAQNVSRFRAEGDKGWIELNPAFGYGGFRMNSSRGPLRFDAPVNQQARQIDDFAQCIREGRESPVSGEMGLRDMKIVEAIYESVKTGKRTLVKD
jgi:glucose-fructose oxidoreductase